MPGAEKKSVMPARGKNFAAGDDAGILETYQL